MKVVEIGKTAEGRPMIMAIITSPENHKNLERYKDIAVRLARAEGITEEQARALATQGKAVVWVDGGLHATEIVNSQTLFWMAYQMVSQNDPETMRILNDVILLLVPVNPDGLELTANWYMRESGSEAAEHAIAAAVSEVRRPRQQPRLVHGRTSPRPRRSTGSCSSSGCRRSSTTRTRRVRQGAILFVPPFRDPFNYN